MSTVLSLIAGTNLLSRNKKFAVVNLYNLEISSKNFEDVLANQQLTDDFKKMIAYFKRVVEMGIKEDFDTSTLDYQPNFSRELNESNLR